MTDRERLHTLVDDLPEPEVHTALRFIETLRHEASDPVARALDGAPFDDEPLTAEDLAAGQLYPSWLACFMINVFVSINEIRQTAHETDLEYGIEALLSTKSNDPIHPTDGLA